MARAANRLVIGGLPSPCPTRLASAPAQILSVLSLGFSQLARLTGAAEAPNSRVASTSAAGQCGMEMLELPLTELE